MIDVAPPANFAAAHVAGTLNIPAASLVRWAGFFVDYAQPIYLIANEALLSGHLRSLRSIGIDNVGGYFDATAVAASGLSTESYRSASPQELEASLADGRVTLVDVRAATEFHEGHIPGARHHFLGTLLRQIDQLPADRPVVTQCLGGGRAAIAASVLQRAGFDVVNMQGGYRAWVAAGLPTVRKAVEVVA